MGQNIVGHYIKKDINTAIMDVGVTYTFKSNGLFQQTIHKHLGAKEISGGEYRILGDTLVLQYERMEENFSSTAELIEKKKLDSPSSFYSNIQIFNSERSPQAGVNLLLQTKDKELVMGFSSDKEGKFPPLSIYDDHTKYLTFSFLGHKEITIKTDSLFGYKTEVRVHLAPSTPTYVNREKTVKLLIENYSADLLELKSINQDKQGSMELRRSD